MKRVRRDPSVQAKVMVEAWGLEKARTMAREAQKRDMSKGANDYWYQVTRQWPPEEVKIPTPPPYLAALAFMKEHGITCTVVPGTRYPGVVDGACGYTLMLDPCQEKFMAPSFIGRTDGSQPSEQGSTPCGATNSGPVV